MKKTTIFYWVIALSSLITSCGLSTQDKKTKLKLWYNKPAEHFEQALVLGNGKVGASIYGGVKKDKIHLNDITLWAGEPVDPYMSPEAYKAVPEVREALEKEDYKKADKLVRQIQGKFSESFAPLGTMYLNFQHKGDASEYYRELDISNAVSKLTYKVGDIQYNREYLVSNPDKLIMIKLSASEKEALNFDVKFESLLKYATANEEGVLVAHGYAPYHAEPNYRGDMPNTVRFDKNRGTRFSNLIKVKETDGEVVVTDSTIQVRGAKEAVLLLSIETSFNGFDKDPAKEGKDNKGLALKYLSEGLAKLTDAIEKTHLDDYHSFFNRLELNLGTETEINLPTDERLQRYATGAQDKNLEILYFQFGRYLLISSSRTLGVPANLQGLWNHYLRPPWSCNYTVNVNVEENYWLAENANLSELHLPMLSWIENVSKTGEVTAKTFLGVQEGWMACHNSDIWAMSNPVGDFGKGHPVWANWYMGGAWLSTHLWEHYSFTQDKAFLQEAYPIMKGAAQFCLNWLIEKNRELITSPSSSPENLYKTDKGYVGATLYGATADLAFIRELFEQCLKATDVLGIDADFKKEMEKAYSDLRPYQIGNKGNLQEWYHDWEDYDPQHRHQTHLFGLYPGHHISTTKTPKLAEASRRTLEIKGDESTGWSKGWRINLWARLKDGNHAYKMYRELLQYVDPSGLKTTYGAGGGTYPNLLDAHPPFQIDGNFGGAAGVIEMLVQSNGESIELLPALPDAWKEGSVKGVCARGGFDLDMEWKDGKLTKLTVLSKAGKKCSLLYQDKISVLETEAGMEYKLNGELIIE
ncbi:glycoside hydrolase family 95 protein [Marinifilum sp.]|uniref:glycoside hydrolase family 95 protein n=1 Tax=Marinifilum sp. TaxID=2033137 RepID=UPI003BAAD998